MKIQSNACRDYAVDTTRMVYKHSRLFRSLLGEMLEQGNGCALLDHEDRGSGRAWRKVRWVNQRPHVRGKGEIVALVVREWGGVLDSRTTRVVWAKF